MSTRRSKAKQGQVQSLPTSDRDRGERHAEPASENPKPSTVESVTHYHRPSASPRRRYRSEGHSDVPISRAEIEGKGERNCRTSQEANGARRSSPNGKYRRPSRPTLAPSQPLTLVERLQSIAGGIRIAELAALLGTGRSTLYDWVEAGTIPAYRHRGVIFFDPVVIAMWLRQQATVVTARSK